MKHCSKNRGGGQFLGFTPAFTLAEVLITLGVIGVVAAITIPMLIQNYKKYIVETRLKHFYTTFNQAFKLAESEFGDWHNWEFNKEKPVYYYVKDYMQLAKVEHKNDRNYYYLFDGSGYYPVYDENSQFPQEFQYIYCPFGIKKCDKTGVERFYFNFNRGAWNSYHFKNPIETNAHGWNGKYADLYDKNSNFGCYVGVKKPNFCSTIIMLNGWKIPKDYPFKF